MTIYTADKIFTGEEWLNDHAVIFEEAKILDVVPNALVKQTDFHSHIIAPAFIDIQIYGAAGKLLAVYPTAASLKKLYEHNLSGGTQFCLPTVATNSYEVFYKSIDAVKKYWSENGKGVLGIHLEGPWISKIKRGAHVESFIHTPSVEQAKHLLDHGKDVIKMMTVAPEVCGKEIIDLIRSYGVVVSAGHSNATFAEAMKGFEGGITAVTHLFNVMTPLHHREPGLPGATLQHTSAMASIIPDGYHVDFEVISIAKKVMQERLFIITDAVTETTEGLYKHHRAGDKYEVENGILSGSALSMIKGVKNCVEKVKIDLGETLRMASLYPAKVLGLENELGMIKKNFRPEFVILNEELNVMSTFTESD